MAHAFEKYLVPKTKLHPQGDFYGSTRLPEFRLQWKDTTGNEHPLQIIGRYAQCTIHADASVRGLAGIKTPCVALADAWHRQFTTNDFVYNNKQYELEDQFPNMPWQLKESVFASMIQELQSTPADFSLAELFALVKYYPPVRQNPNWVVTLPIALNLEPPALTIKLTSINDSRLYDWVRRCSIRERLSIDLSEAGLRQIADLVEDFNISAFLYRGSGESPLSTPLSDSVVQRASTPKLLREAILQRIQVYPDQQINSAFKVRPNATTNQTPSATLPSTKFAPTLDIAVITSHPYLKELLQDRLQELVTFSGWSSKDKLAKALVQEPDAWPYLTQLSEWANSPARLDFLPSYLAHQVPPTLVSTWLPQGLQDWRAIKAADAIQATLPQAGPGHVAQLAYHWSELAPEPFEAILQNQSALTSIVAWQEQGWPIGEVWTRIQSHLALGGVPILPAPEIYTQEVDSRASQNRAEIEREVENFIESNLVTYPTRVISEESILGLAVELV